MWDVCLDAMNMFYYHWLIKKLIWSIASRIEQSEKSKQREGEKEGRVRETPAVTGEARSEVNTTGT